MFLFFSHQTILQQKVKELKQGEVNYVTFIIKFWYKSVIIRLDPWKLTSDEWLTLDLGPLLGALGSVVLGADELSGVAEALAPVCQVERGRVAAKVSNHCFICIMQQIKVEQIYT